MSALAEDDELAMLDPFCDAPAEFFEFRPDDDEPASGVWSIPDEPPATTTTPAPTPVETCAPWSNLTAAYERIGAERNWHSVGAIEGNPIAIYAGPEKKDKSWTMIQYAVATVIGGAWLGCFQVRRSGSVLYLDGEYGEAEFARRVVRIARGMKADPRDVLPHIRHLYSTGVSLIDSNNALHAVCEDARTIHPSLVVVDPYRNHLEGDENIATVNLAAFAALHKLRAAAACPVITVHHLNKAGGYSGSRAIMSRADLIVEGSDGERPVYTTRGRTLRRGDAIASPFSVTVAHTNDHDDTIATTTVAASGVESRKDGRPLTVQILAALLDEPCTKAKLRKLTRRNTEDIESAISELFTGRWITKIKVKAATGPAADAIALREGVQEMARAKVEGE